MFAKNTNEPVREVIPAHGLFVLESQHGDRFRMPMRRDPFFKLIYVLKGAGELRLISRAQRLAQGTLATVPANTQHQLADAPNEPMTLLVLCIAKTVMQRLPDGFARMDGEPRVLRNDGLRHEAEGLLRSLFFEQSMDRPGAATAMTGLALQLLATVARAASPEKLAPLPSAGGPESRVAAYVRELPQRFHESEKLDTVCDRLGISRRYFTRLFKKLSGKSWLQAVRELRLAHAKNLLRRSGRTIITIAFESGYEDLSTFYRAFTAAEGLAPQAWREKHAPAHI